jgi:hypothetical protein
MKRFLITLMVIALCSFFLSPAAIAQRAGKGAGAAGGTGVELQVTSKDAAGSSNPNEAVYTVAVNVVNKGSVPLQFSNNQFALIATSGKRYLVTRGRFPESVFIKPGESARCDRIFFTTPKGEKIDSIILFAKGRVLGKAAF